MPDCGFSSVDQAKKLGHVYITADRPSYEMMLGTDLSWVDITTKCCQVHVTAG